MNETLCSVTVDVRWVDQKEAKGVLAALVEKGASGWIRTASSLQRLSSAAPLPDGSVVAAEVAAGDTSLHVQYVGPQCCVRTVHKKPGTTHVCETRQFRGIEPGDDPGMRTVGVYETFWPATLEVHAPDCSLEDAWQTPLGPTTHRFVALERGPGGE